MTNTSTLRLGKNVYSAVGGGGAAVQTDIVVAQALPVGPFANYKCQQILTLNSVPVFTVDDLGLVEVEATFVLANTGTLAIVALGCHVNFNFN